ncbi:MAG: TIGR04282 family arsenosugar biosynthesis glycosyltransferase [Desulfobacterales bacterium]
MRKECVLFFAKWPEKGKVKTRLARDIGSDHAVNLYRCFILDLAETLKKLSQDVIVCYSPKNAEPMFRSWLGDQFSYFPQSDGDLGMRMKKSFVQAFEKKYDRAVLIGSDCPDLTQKVLEQAFVELTNANAVIGPAADGGYWLIGFQVSGFCPPVFEGISWSTETVFAETMKKFTQKKINAAVLPKYMDIDTITNLREWHERHEPSFGCAFHTRSYIKSMK